MNPHIAVFVEAEAMARNLAASCVGEASEQPKHRDYWLSEAKRHEERADHYREQAERLAQFAEANHVH
jgi:hypothetical protein